MTTKELFFALLKNEITGEDPPGSFVLTEDDLPGLYRLSKSQCLAHLICDAMFRQKCLPNDKIPVEFKKEMSFAALNDERQSAVIEKIRGIFNDRAIDFVLLKGPVIKSLYGESWMRNSRDIDILVREKDVKKASAALVENGFSTDNIRHYHNYSFYFENVRIELHFTLCENVGQLDKMLCKVWEHTEKLDGYEYRETSEYYAFHHMAHMAYDFTRGGCGVRPLIDLWLMRQKRFYSEDGLQKLLSVCDLTAFYSAACRLCEVWFGDASHDDLSMRMQSYILSGGAYGNMHYTVPMEIAKNKGNKFLYLLKMAFLPYRNMCVFYPFLVKHKILLPFCYIHRVFVKLFGKDKKRIRERIEYVNANTNESVGQFGKLLNDLKLG